MPTSYVETIPQIIKIIQEVKPKHVLDIGIGNGKYGLLTQEYCEGVVVDGVEAWQPYITEIQKAIYRKIYTQDIRAINAKNLSGYDLILMIDVIEHLQKKEAHRVLNSFEGLVLISTPVEDYRAHYENHYEDHVSHWGLKDFKKYSYKDHSTSLSTIVLLDMRKKKKKIKNIFSKN
jgi:2-polyprenyl-3-methyl-5-hydroxy-6-metoxy-1,4-benzoquinol methylase